MEKTNSSQNCSKQMNYGVFYYVIYDNKVNSKRKQSCVTTIKQSGVIRAWKEENQHMKKTCNTKGRAAWHCAIGKITAVKPKGGHKFHDLEDSTSAKSQWTIKVVCHVYVFHFYLCVVSWPYLEFCKRLKSDVDTKVNYKIGLFYSFFSTLKVH